MGEPIFWLGVSLCLVAVCLALVLMTAIPAFQELSRAARSAEKLFDTLQRELPPTLDAIRSTSHQVSDLKADLSQSVDQIQHVIAQVDHSLTEAREQVHQTQVTVRSLWTGMSVGIHTFFRVPRQRHPGRRSNRRRLR
ncbi:DUF948 domain-containing protein [Lyngbya confervoides]|uniref:t-SNARE coiled-coil homology domain-containing protein n=1 Tax=Lyngbya confervoides BDU141951 TaxID=1574623 RepID=A0ABD4T207_9CYAN|nr:DUF948 domain-containing protein [Lyngbya confervoides]MCM1982468.1 hypothetical protein [Lyngbya confervoides BDU141951]